jgi:hypothetical protein
VVFVVGRLFQDNKTARGSEMDVSFPARNKNNIIGLRDTPRGVCVTRRYADAGQASYRLHCRDALR